MSSGVLPCCNSYSLEPKETFTSRGNAERSSLLLAIQVIGRTDGGYSCFVPPPQCGCAFRAFSSSILWQFCHIVSSPIRGSMAV